MFKSLSPTIELPKQKKLLFAFLIDGLLAIASLSIIICLTSYYSVLQACCTLAMWNKTNKKDTILFGKEKKIKTVT